MEKVQEWEQDNPDYKKLKRESTQLMQNMYEWVYDNYPDTIKYVMDSACQKQQAFMLCVNKSSSYQIMFYTYGILYFLACIQYFIQVEGYERCQKMIDAVNEHNKALKHNLPITLDDTLCKKWEKMTPSEILNSLTP